LRFTERCKDVSDVPDCSSGPSLTYNERGASQKCLQCLKLVRTSTLPELRHGAWGACACRWCGSRDGGRCGPNRCGGSDRGRRHGAHQCQQTRTVRQEAVSSTVRGGGASLVQELEAAGVDRHGLVVGGADEVAVADVVGPSGAAVSLASEGGSLGGGLRRPRAGQARGREGAEVAPIRTDRLDDHEVLALALHRVHLYGLEQVVGRVTQDDGRCRTKAAREIADGHASAVDVAVVTSEEEVHVRAVADEGLVDGAGGARYSPREERLRRGPPVRVGGVGRRTVAEGDLAPLVGENPYAFWSEEEEGGRDAGCGHTGLARRRHIRPVREGAEAHRAPCRSPVVRRAIYEVLPVEGYMGEVLERYPPRLRSRQGGRRCPFVCRRESACLRRNSRRRRQERNNVRRGKSHRVLVDRKRPRSGELETERAANRGFYVSTMRSNDQEQDRRSIIARLLPLQSENSSVNGRSGIFRRGPLIIRNTRAL
jgi:hypothetical protein